MDGEATEREAPVPIEIDCAALADFRARQLPRHSLDVREPWESAICAIGGSRFLPMRQIPARLAELPRDGALAVVCHHGHRSLEVASWLHGQGFGAATSPAAGFDAWAQTVDPALPRY